MVDKKKQKLVDQTFEHEGHVVFFNEVPREYSGTFTEYAQERRRWLVSVDGDVCAIVRKPYGFGKQGLIIEKLSKSYSSIYGDNILLANDYKNDKYDLVQVVKLIVDRRSSPHDRVRLPTAEEAAIAERDYAARERRAKKEANDRAEQDRRQRKSAARDGIEQRSAEIEGLVELQARADLSNIQLAALDAAIRALTSERNRYQDELDRIIDWEDAKIL